MIIFKRKAIIFFHGLFECLAYIVGFQYYLYLRSHTKDNLNNTQRMIILIAGLFGALVGSRGLAIFEHITVFLQTSNTWLFLLSNKTIVGGLLGALIAIELGKIIFNIRYSSGDLMTYPLIIGIIIGRLGCLSAGVMDGTYGTPTQLPWGVDLGDSILRHPTNLYEILFLIAIFCILRSKDKQLQQIDGLKFSLFLFLYLIFRFFVEYIKPEPSVLWHLSAIQLAAMAGIVYYCFKMYRVYWKMSHA